VDEITAVKSVGVAGGEPLALVAIFLLLCYAVAWSVDLYLPLSLAWRVERERERETSLRNRVARWACCGVAAGE